MATLPQAKHSGTVSSVSSDNLTITVNTTGLQEVGTSVSVLNSDLSVEIGNPAGSVFDDYSIYRLRLCAFYSSTGTFKGVGLVQSRSSTTSFLLSFPPINPETLEQITVAADDRFAISTHPEDLSSTAGFTFTESTNTLEVTTVLTIGTSSITAVNSTRYFLWMAGYDLINSVSGANNFVFNGGLLMGGFSLDGRSDILTSKYLITADSPYQNHLVTTAQSRFIWVGGSVIIDKDETSTKSPRYIIFTATPDFFLIKNASCNFDFGGQRGDDVQSDRVVFENFVWLGVGANAIFKRTDVPTIKSANLLTLNQLVISYYGADTTGTYRELAETDSLLLATLSNNNALWRSSGATAQTVNYINVSSQNYNGRTGAGAGNLGVNSMYTANIYFRRSFRNLTTGTKVAVIRADVFQNHFTEGNIITETSGSVTKSLLLGTVTTGNTESFNNNWASYVVAYDRLTLTDSFMRTTDNLNRHDLMFGGVQNQIVDPVTTLTKTQIDALTSNNFTYDNVIDSITSFWIDNITLTNIVSKPFNQINQVANLADWVDEISIVTTQTDRVTFTTIENVFVVRASTLTVGTNNTSLNLGSSNNLRLHNGISLDNQSIICNRLFKPAPTNITGLNLTGELVFNTNTDMTIDITDSTLSVAPSNTGTGIITINSINSTIPQPTDAQVVLNDSSVTITTPAGYTDEIGIYTTRAGAENETASLRLYLGQLTILNYSSGVLGGMTVFYRLEDAARNAVIRDYMIPVAAGNYRENILVTPEESTLAELLAFARIQNALVEMNGEEYRFKDSSRSAGDIVLDSSVSIIGNEVQDIKKILESTSLQETGLINSSVLPRELNGIGSFNLTASTETINGSVINTTTLTTTSNIIASGVSSSAVGDEGQDITVPNIDNVKLRVFIKGNVITQTINYTPRFEVTVTGGTNTDIDEREQRVDTISAVSTEFSIHTFDLSAYAGQTINILFFIEFFSNVASGTQFEYYFELGELSHLATNADLTHVLGTQITNTERTNLLSGVSTLTPAERTAVATAVQTLLLTDGAGMDDFLDAIRAKLMDFDFDNADATIVADVLVTRLSGLINNVNTIKAYRNLRAITPNFNLISGLTNSDLTISNSNGTVSASAINNNIQISTSGGTLTRFNLDISNTFTAGIDNVINFNLLCTTSIIIGTIRVEVVSNGVTYRSVETLSNESFTANVNTSLSFSFLNAFPAESVSQVTIVFDEGVELFGLRTFTLSNFELVRQEAVPDIISPAEFHANLDNYNNKEDYAATGFATPNDVTASQTAITDILEIIRDFDQVPYRLFALDGSTEVYNLDDAFEIKYYENDGTTTLKRFGKTVTATDTTRVALSSNGRIITLS